MGQYNKGNTTGIPHYFLPDHVWHYNANLIDTDWCMRNNSKTIVVLKIIIICQTH